MLLKYDTYYRGRLVTTYGWHYGIEHLLWLHAQGFTFQSLTSLLADFHEDAPSLHAVRYHVDLLERRGVLRVSPDGVIQHTDHAPPFLTKEAKKERRCQKSADRAQAKRGFVAKLKCRLTREVLTVKEAKKLAAAKKRLAKEEEKAKFRAAQERLKLDSKQAKAAERQALRMAREKIKREARSKRVSSLLQARRIIVSLKGEFDASDVARIALYRNIEVSLQQAKIAVAALRKEGVLTPAQRRNHYTYNTNPRLGERETIDMATYPPVKNYRPLHPY